MPTHILVDLLLILASGLLAAAACRRLGVSMVIGYLVIGALIGDGVLGLVAAEQAQIEQLARAGVLLLLFSIGLELAPAALRQAGRAFVAGGGLQMALVTLPVAGVAMLGGMPAAPAVLTGLAVALSSTVLVFRALEELGLTTSASGRRAIAILLFQDVALVPILLLVPWLAENREPPPAYELFLLAAKSLILVLGVVALRGFVSRMAAPALSAMRSLELIILLALTMLGGIVMVAGAFGLPTALGALAAGFVFSGSRLAGQVDALVLPFRETFAAVFFVSLGLLLRPGPLWGDAPFLLAALAGIIGLKWVAGAVGLRAGGLPWGSAWGMGLGLAQLGEFSFVLILFGSQGGVLGEESYQRVLFLALATLVLTPQLLKVGVRWAVQGHAPRGEEPAVALELEGLERAIVVGMGPAGRLAASRLETSGADVCLVDLSPVNLHPFAQQGFRTVSGDGTDPDVLEHAGVLEARIVVVSPPDDLTSLEVLRAVRTLNSRCHVVVRCRFRANAEGIRRAGAQQVVVEELEVAAALVDAIDRFERERSAGGAGSSPRGPV